MLFPYQTYGESGRKKFTSALQLHGFSKGAALMLVPNHQPKSSPNVSKAA